MNVVKTSIIVFLFFLLVLTAFFCLKPDVIEEDIVEKQEEFVTGAGLGGGRYFLIKNSSGSDLFEVGQAGDMYTAQLADCDTIDTDENGSWSCGTDDDTTYTDGNGCDITSEVVTVAGNTCLTQDVDGLSVTADCIGDTQLEHNTGQGLTISDSPRFAGGNYTGNVAMTDKNITYVDCIHFNDGGSICTAS